MFESVRNKNGTNFYKNIKLKKYAFFSANSMHIMVYIIRKEQYAMDKCKGLRKRNRQKKQLKKCNVLFGKLELAKKIWKKICLF